MRHILVNTVDQQFTEVFFVFQFSDNFRTAFLFYLFYVVRYILPGNSEYYSLVYFLQNVSSYAALRFLVMYMTSFKNSISFIQVHKTELQYCPNKLSKFVRHRKKTDHPSIMPVFGRKPMNLLFFRDFPVNRI